MSKILLKDGTLFLHKAEAMQRGDVLIDNGRIAQVGGNIPANDARVHDLGGKVVSPGFIDLQTHICEHWQDVEPAIQAATLAAVKGGFTTLCAMPDTNPPLDNEGMIRLIISLAESKGFARVLPSASATKGLEGKILSEIGTLVQAGAALIYDSDKTITNAKLLRRLMEYSKMFTVPLFVHCEDPDLAAAGVMHEGFTSMRLGLPGIPSVAETVMVQRDLALASYTDASVHVTHVSTRESVEAIRLAKKRGVRVTCSVTPHHLDLTDRDIKQFDADFKVSPPLRGEEDRQAILEGFKDGTLDCIATDHRGGSSSDHTVHFHEAPFGFTSLETCFQVGYNRLVLEKYLTLPEFLHCLTRRPAEILHREDLGILRIGAVADITIMDIHTQQTITEAFLDSGTYRTPFIGRTFGSKIEMCFVGGVLAYAAG